MATSEYANASWLMMIGCPPKIKPGPAIIGVIFSVAFPPEKISQFGFSCRIIQYDSIFIAVEIFTDNKAHLNHPQEVNMNAENNDNRTLEEEVKQAVGINVKDKVREVVAHHARTFLRH